MEIQTGHIKAMVGLDRKDSADYQPCKNFSQAHESALIQPISILAALESGKVTLSDKVDVGNGIYSIQDRELKSLSSKVWLQVQILLFIKQWRKHLVTMHKHTSIY